MHTRWVWCWSWTDCKKRRMIWCFDQMRRAFWWGGRGKLVSHLTCNAVLGSAPQSFCSCQWWGLGQRLTTAKESSRSDGETACVCEGGKCEQESASVQRIPAVRTQPAAHSQYILSTFPRAPLFQPLFFTIFSVCLRASVVISTDCFCLPLSTLHSLYCAPASEPLFFWWME